MWFLEKRKPTAVVLSEGRLVRWGRFFLALRRRIRCWFFLLNAKHWFQEDGCALWAWVFSSSIWISLILGCLTYEWRARCEACVIVRLSPREVRDHDAAIVRASNWELSVESQSTASDILLNKEQRTSNLLRPNSSKFDRRLSAAALWRLVANWEIMCWDYINAVLFSYGWVPTHRAKSVITQWLGTMLVWQSEDSELVNVKYFIMLESIRVQSMKNRSQAIITRFASMNIFREEAQNGWMDVALRKGVILHEKSILAEWFTRRRKERKDEIWWWSMRLNWCLYAL